MVFKRFSEHDIGINAEACVLGIQEMSFLGYLVNEQGTRARPEKMIPILNYDKPKTINDLRRYLGLLNYYRRNISQVAYVKSFLSDFLKGSRKSDQSEIV